MGANPGHVSNQHQRRKGGRGGGGGERQNQSERGEGGSRRKSKVGRGKNKREEGGREFHSHCRAMFLLHLRHMDPCPEGKLGGQGN